MRKAFALVSFAFLGGAAEGLDMYRSTLRAWNFTVFGCNKSHLGECFVGGTRKAAIDEFFTAHGDRESESHKPGELFAGVKDLVFGTEKSKLRFLLTREQYMTLTPKVTGLN
eukprot:Selendium_serpulae@DN1703_c0_g1_i1.p2